MLILQFNRNESADCYIFIIYTKNHLKRKNESWEDSPSAMELTRQAPCSFATRFRLEVTI
jgi:hypothetical protein